jgi:hypothetical protein
MKYLFYVAGKFDDRDNASIFKNIIKASFVAAWIRRGGHYAIIPHIESFMFSKVLSREQWLEHGLVLMTKCDKLVFLDNFEESVGTQLEITEALRMNKPVYDIDQLLDFLKEDNTTDINFSNICNRLFFDKNLDFLLRTTKFYLLTLCEKKELDSNYIVSDGKVLCPGYL